MTSVKRNGQIEFRFYRPGASQVKLAGEFSGWMRDAIAMQHEGNGWWSAAVRLDAGEYRFRYVADGQWYTDYAANGIEHTKHGVNSLVVVPEEIKVIRRPLAKAA